MTHTMRAYTLNSFEETPAFADMPIPEPGPNEVRVRVRASSVNPVDAATSVGAFRTMYEYRFPSVQGRDFAGTIDAVGAAVTRFQPGDDVFGMVKRDYVGDGTFAEYVVVDAQRFITVRPEALSLADAGALGLAGVTALQCVEALELQPGATVFINGATGGVGAFAIQIAVLGGLEVIATARTGEEERHVRELGATHTVDWTTEDVTEAILQLRPGGADGVIDLISRDPDSFRRIAAAAGPGGTAVTTLGAARDQPEDGPVTKNIHSDSDPVLLTRIAEIVVDGSVRVPLVDTFPFERIEDAFALLATGPLGKVGLQLE
ncbi:NADP-dependent oxidoreductase [Microbacterium sp. A196]|uniref:NADP-dependent oxidoreductase n=1 Tax=Microbacterium sp. A196 TaxID=3457320 RepID=UPI003FCF9A7A